MAKRWKWLSSAVVLAGALLLVFSVAGIGVAQQEVNPLFDGLASGQPLDAAAAEQLTATSLTKTLSPMDFGAIDGAVTLNRAPDGFCATATGSGSNSWQLTAPIDLPEGAVITGFTSHWWDTDAGIDVNVVPAFTVLPASGANVTHSGLLSILSTGSGGFGETTVASSLTVGPGTNHLWLVYQGSATTGICGFDVHYDIPSDHENLVFTPLASPCSVFDTKTAADWGRRIGKPDGVIPVKVATLTPTEITDQGALACASTAVPSDAVAVAITIIARGPLERGAISMAASGGVLDVVTSYSDVAQSNNGNEVSVGLTGGSIDLKIGGIAVLDESVNVRAVVNGYYTAQPIWSD